MPNTKPATEPATKLVRIELSGLTRQCWETLLEVPANTSDDDLASLVRYFYEITDAGEFQDDEQFWERGTCLWTPVAAGVPDWRLDSEGIPHRVPRLNSTQRLLAASKNALRFIGQVAASPDGIVAFDELRESIDAIETGEEEPYVSDE